MKPYAEACERNKDPILAVLRAAFAEARGVLEIGSGTGQHAVYFAGHLPHLTWQTSDLAENHAGILAWIEDAGLVNVRPPLLLDVRQDPWPDLEVDAVFTANTMHIVSWPELCAMIEGVGRLLPADGVFCSYGPYMYGGQHTAVSNAAFDEMLRRSDPASGVRDVDALEELAAQVDLVLEADHAMPANNRTLVWRKL